MFGTEWDISHGINIKMVYSKLIDISGSPTYLIKCGFNS